MAPRDCLPAVVVAAGARCLLITLTLLSGDARACDCTRTLLLSPRDPAGVPMNVRPAVFVRDAGVAMRMLERATGSEVAVVTSVQEFSSGRVMVLEPKGSLAADTAYLLEVGGPGRWAPIGTFQTGSRVDSDPPASLVVAARPAVIEGGCRTGEPGFFVDLGVDGGGEAPAYVQVWVDGRLDHVARADSPLTLGHPSRCSLSSRLIADLDAHDVVFHTFDQAGNSSSSALPKTRE